MKAIDSAARINDGEGAQALLGADPRPATVRAVACRADELRFEDPKAALEVANAATNVVRMGVKAKIFSVLAWGEVK